jgi:SAM-dependent methyltransferase
MSRIDDFTQLRDTWDGFADIYDQWTAFHDHAAWARQLDALVRAGGGLGRRLLDVGCGTGASTSALRELGYEPVGVDVSQRMLELAAARLGPDVELHRHDMRELPALGQFDLISCVSDGLNYLLDEASLVAAFDGFRRNLAPGGRVVFDVDTLAAFRKLYSSLLVLPQPDRIVIFDGRAERSPAAGDVADAVVEVLTPAASPWWSRTRAIHRQRHHPQSTIEAALRSAGLAPVALWGTDGAGGSDQALDDKRHNKAVYIAQLAA